MRALPTFSSPPFHTGSYGGENDPREAAANAKKAKVVASGDAALIAKVEEEVQAAAAARKKSSDAKSHKDSHGKATSSLKAEKAGLEEELLSLSDVEDNSLRRTAIANRIAELVLAISTEGNRLRAEKEERKTNGTATHRNRKRCSSGTEK